MCLAIPSKIVDIKGGMATIDADGVKRSISLILLENVCIGDYIIVHAGFAIKKLDEFSALKSIELLKKAANYDENY